MTHIRLIRFILLFLVSTRIGFKALILSIATEPLSTLCWMLHFSACLFKAPCSKAQSALIGQLLQAWACIDFHWWWCFCNHGHADFNSDGGDCMIVTSETLRSPDSLFKSTISEWALYIESLIKQIDTFTVFIGHLNLLVNQKRYGNLTF